MAATKSHATLEKWIWILIYGGLFLLILGIATGRTEEAVGWSMTVPGVVIALVGVVLIYVRSRLKDSKQSKESP
jgi:membrane protein implicated in regulation of membrane protease activity